MFTHIPNAVLWDMDGVLVDTSHLHIEAWEYVFAEYGIPFDRQYFKKIFGLKNSDFIQLVTQSTLDEQCIKTIITQKETLFRQISRHLTPLPGVAEWLERFKSWGCKQAIASSGEADNVEHIVDVLGIREFFDARVTPGNLPGKPDPAVFLLAASVLNVPAKRCIVIEDSIPGVEAACKAGIRCIAVTITNPPELLLKADIVVEQLDKLSSDQVVALFS